MKLLSFSTRQLKDSRHYRQVKLTVSGRRAEKRYERAYGAADRLPNVVATNAR